MTVLLSLFCLSIFMLKHSGPSKSHYASQSKTHGYLLKKALGCIVFPFPFSLLFCHWSEFGVYHALFAALLSVYAYVDGALGSAA